jgi:hypothetical protein
MHAILVAQIKLPPVDIDALLVIVREREQASTREFGICVRCQKCGQMPTHKAIRASNQNFQEKPLSSLPMNYNRWARICVVYPIAPTSVRMAGMSKREKTRLVSAPRSWINAAIIIGGIMGLIVQAILELDSEAAFVVVGLFCFGAVTLVNVFWLIKERRQ